MVAGWTGVLFFTFLLAVLAPDLGTSGWIGLSIMNQIFLMLAGDDDNLAPLYIRQGSGDQSVACMLQIIHLFVCTDFHSLLFAVDVPADGYSVECGQLETLEEKGLVSA